MDKKAFCYFLILFANLAAVCQSLPTKTNEDVFNLKNVLVLAKENFTETLEQHKNVIVLFYAPWCRYSQAFAPEFGKAAKILRQLKPEVKLALLNADFERELKKEYKVKAYPTVKLFRKAAYVTDYAGQRVAKDFVDWTIKRTEPAVKEISSMVEIASLIDNSEQVVVLGLFKDQDSKNAKIFIETGDRNVDKLFVLTSSEEVTDALGVKDGQVLLFKKFDERRVSFDDEFSIENLENFVRIQSIPLIVEYDSDWYREIFVDKHLYVALSKKAGHYEKYMDELRNSAEEFRGKMAFVTMDVDDYAEEDVLEFFGSKKDQAPFMFAVKTENQAKFRPKTRGIDERTVQKFVADVLDNKIRPYEWEESSEF